jgi:hypothetical protein
MVKRGHVVVTRDGQSQWRSRGRFEPNELSALAIGASGVAFSVTHGDVDRLYVATGRGPERAVAWKEEPVSWMPGGNLVTERYGGNWSTWRLRAPSGRLIEALRTRRLYWPEVDPRDGTVVFVTRSGKIERFDGIRWRHLADARAFGFEFGPSDGPSVQVLADGRIELARPGRIVILDPDGSLYAQARFHYPRGGWGGVGSFGGSSTIDPVTGAVVFVVTRWAYGDGSSGWPGWEGVYSLSRGDTVATKLYGRHLMLQPCAHMARLAWHGRWVLYSSCEGSVAAIDTSGEHRAVVLTHVGRRLPSPPGREGYVLDDARWAAKA